MNCKWINDPSDELKSSLRMCNVLFPAYIRYCRGRGTNLTTVEYKRNIVPMLLSGMIDRETIEFCKLEIEMIEKDLGIENSILKEVL